jgi:hypothetical protein
MKKAIRFFLVAGFLALSSLAFAQNSDNPHFVSKILPPIPKMIKETASIRVSFIDGKVENTNAFSLVFENKSNQPITFTWTLKDKSGNVVGESHKITLTANSILDYSSKSEFANALVFTLPQNSVATDYTVEITN